MPKLSFTTFLPVAIMLLMSFPSQAQHESSNKIRHSRHSIAISWGILSRDQLRATGASEAPGYRDLVDMPNRYSGAAFLTYRYAIANDISVGVSIGLDNQTGRLSYCGPHSSYWGTPGDAGQYHREFYTAGIDARYCYKEGQTSLYCLVGGGITSGHVNYRIYPDAQYNFYSLYTPISRSSVTYNFQLTPFGVTTQTRLAFSFEVGYGYKGLLCLGMTYHI